MSHAVHSIRSLCKLLSSYRDMYSEHSQTFKLVELFAKIIMPEYKRTTRKFSGQGKFCAINISLKTQLKKGPAGKHFGAFSPRYS